VGVHNFVLGDPGQARYPLVMASTVSTPAEMAGQSRWKSAPSYQELALLAFTTAAIFLATVSYFRSYESLVRDAGDNGAYIVAASGIRHWNFDGVRTKQFWGYSYVIAGVSAVTRTPERTSLLVVCWLCSAASVALAFRLWGGWVAGLFAVTNFEWLQRSYLGGAEPLFVLMLFVSFWAIRKERWVLASGLAACATVTRPIGVLALLAIGIALLIRRDYRKAALCTALALTIGALYLAPFWLYFGDPLYQVHRYQSADWHSGPPVTWPFLAISSSVIHNTQPWTNLALTLSWVAFVLTGAIAMLRKSFQAQLHERPAEFIFALLYISFLFSYNSPEWARSDFVRFAIPVLPLVFVAIGEWIPRDRRLLWATGMVSGLMAGASAIGIRNVMHAL
jgi:hypothetical protein